MTMLPTLTETTVQLTQMASHVLAAPDPGGGTEPPGFDKVLTVLKWLAWGASAAGVAGFIGCGTRMFWDHQHSQGGQHAMRVGMVALGCIMVSAAGPITTALLG